MGERKMHNDYVLVTQWSRPFLLKPSKSNFVSSYCASFLLQLQYTYLQFQNMHGLMCTFVEIHVLVCTLRFLVTIAIHAPTVSKHARINVCCTNQFFKLTTVKPFAIYSSNIFLKLSQSQKFW